MIILTTTMLYTFPFACCVTISNKLKWIFLLCITWGDSTKAKKNSCLRWIFFDSKLVLRNANQIICIFPIFCMILWSWKEEYFFSRFSYRINQINAWIIFKFSNQHFYFSILTETWLKYFLLLWLLCVPDHQKNFNHKYYTYHQSYALKYYERLSKTLGHQ